MKLMCLYNTNNNIYLHSEYKPFNYNLLFTLKQVKHR